MLAGGGMSTVFMVTAGEYSDYHVVGIFSTREKAEAYVAWQHGPDSKVTPSYNSKHGIEEVELDSVIIADTGAFSVRGSVEALIAGVKPGNTIQQHWNAEQDPNAPPQGFYSKWMRNGPEAIGYGATVEHAARSAREMARAIKAGTVTVVTSERYGQTIYELS